MTRHLGELSRKEFIELRDKMTEPLAEEKYGISGSLAGRYNIYSALFKEYKKAREAKEVEELFCDSPNFIEEEIWEMSKQFGQPLNSLREKYLKIYKTDWVQNEFDSDDDRHSYCVRRLWIQLGSRREDTVGPNFLGARGDRGR